MSTYKTLITALGAALEAAHHAAGTQIIYATIRVGDGGGVPVAPNPAHTALVNQVYSGALNSLEVDPDNPAQFIAEMIIPAAYGGWTIREMSLNDDAGRMIFVGNCGDTYKPTAGDGATSDMLVRMTIAVSNPDTVTIINDPSIVAATRSWVTSNFLKKSNNLSDLADVVTARANLGVYSVAETNTAISTAVGAETTRAMTAEALLAPLAGPTFTGTVRAPTKSPPTDSSTIIATTQFVQQALALIAASIPGGIIIWPHFTAPSGYLECDGSAISRTTYAALFAEIGVLFGPGDGSTTFNIPDLRGEFIRGWDHGRGIDPALGGRSFGSYQGDAMRNITGTAEAVAIVQGHPYPVTHGSITTNGGSGIGDYTGSDFAEVGSIDFDASLQVPTSTENRPTNVAMMFIIKT